MVNDKKIEDDDIIELKKRNENEEYFDVIKWKYFLVYK